MSSVISKPHENLLLLHLSDLRLHQNSFQPSELLHYSLYLSWLIAMHRTLVIFLAVPSRAVNESSSEGLGRPKKARESQRWSVKAREGPRKPEKAPREPG